MRSLLASQLTFVNRLVQLMKAVQRESGNRKKKVCWRISLNKLPVYSADKIKREPFLSPCAQTERLQALLADNEKVNLSEFEPIPLPLEPQIRITGIIPETATLFKVKSDIIRNASFKFKMDRLDSWWFFLFFFNLSVYIRAH